MNQQLEELLRAFEAYQEAASGADAERLQSIYEALFQDVCARSKTSPEVMERLLKWAYPRWQWAKDPNFPKNLRKIKLD